jgi:hypothetical protein
VARRKRYSCSTCGTAFAVEAVREAEETKVIPRFTHKAKKDKRCHICKCHLSAGLSRLHLSILKANGARFSLYLCQECARNHFDITLRPYATYYDWITEEDDDQEGDPQGASS